MDAAREQLFYELLIMLALALSPWSTGKARLSGKVPHLDHAIYIKALLAEEGDSVAVGWVGLVNIISPAGLPTTLPCASHALFPPWTTTQIPDRLRVYGDCKSGAKASSQRVSSRCQLLDGGVCFGFPSVILAWPDAEDRSRKGAPIHGSLFAPAAQYICISIANYTSQCFVPIEADSQLSPIYKTHRCPVYDVPETSEISAVQQGLGECFSEEIKSLRRAYFCIDVRCPKAASFWISSGL
ncbi:hypothetical protein OE88DRAFT_1721647 [Heliocybe sulcata]|uniref:Uncharacterized protein n=1 Tax=Heliocybe sulcata TaxID=5364 RepID=A0A5C3NIW9_9AGAM|nr:hypothetical protein OE88DRAFT_1721647 [Heliocybe sulcata]